MMKTLWDMSEIKGIRLSALKTKAVYIKKIA